MQVTSRYLWHALLLWDWLKKQTWQNTGTQTLWQGHHSLAKYCQEIPSRIF